MTDINWSIFKSKFHQRESIAFENLSYQLFCFEFDQPYGIFRFKNQAGIETEPITVDEAVIGFQAKYYETKLADNKKDIIDAVKKAKQKNSSLTTLFVYVNREFAENPKKELKDPKYKTDIEAASKKLNVDIVWRVPSHFEIQLADTKNSHIADYYFKNGPSIIDFLKSIDTHTENILFSIQNDIKYGSDTIRIDRTEIVSKLKVAQNSITILTGDGGSGKTAIIKDLYNETKGLVPFYVFKALEFDVPNIQNVFSHYNNYTFDDFLNIHKDSFQKIIVIDSAESLSEVNSRETFKEFLSALIKDSWQIIFTTRNNYLDDLKFIFINVYRILFDTISIKNPDGGELLKLALAYNFKLPDSLSVQELLGNLFYLDEYLTNYDQFDETITLRRFKEVLWNKKIQDAAFKQKNTHIKRENCFLEIAKERVSSGKFFVHPTNCTDDILSLLQRDEIIKYDNSNGGYFITHDIYEEWALEVFIDRAYNTCETYSGFICTIGNALAVRRSFRKWLSQKINESIADIEQFITQIISSPDIDIFWKDEFFITILLSEYSSIFFSKFENLVIDNDFSLLKRIIFLLRIACKEPDDFHNQLYQDVDLKYVFTKPKGSGWNSVIDLLFKNINLFKEDNIKFFIPVLIEWTNRNRFGETTRQAGIIALNLYRKTEEDTDFKYLNIEKKIVEIVLNSAIEIKEELKLIFAEIISNDITKRNAPFFELISAILTSRFENITIIKALPKEVIALADKFWLDDKKNQSPYYSPTGKEEYFGISGVWQSEYTPASAYKAPVYRLLHYDFNATINFIIELMNKVILVYQDSKFGENLEEITLQISKRESRKQYICDDIWSMYRGSGHAPSVLQSIHMALEKYLLEITPNTKEEIVESWLIYILKESSSASMTAVVASLIKANPDKFFNTAKILFASPEILLSDRLCVGSEYNIRSLSNIGKGWNYQNKYYEDEREEALNQSHRKTTLETIMVNYQFFRNQTTPQEIADERQKEIYKIIDDLYARFPEKPDSSDDYMVKRLLIARLDRRIMKPIVEKKDNQVLINMNPQIAPDLKQHSKEALQGIDAFMQYSALNLWANSKFRPETQGNYEKYDSEPLLALKEAKELIKELNTKPEERFSFRNGSIPGYVCAALVKDFSNTLNDEDLIFCKDVIFYYATLPINTDYDYQISDGVEVCINVLPQVAKLLPDTMPTVRTVLLFTLFDDTSIGEYKRVCDYAIETISGDMLRLHGEKNSEFIEAFLKFRPLLEKMKKTGMRSLYSDNDLLERFSKKYSNELKAFEEGKETLNNNKIEELPIEILEIAFKLIPADTQNQELINLAKKIIIIAARAFLVKDNDHNFRYSLRTNFFKRFSYFLLYRNPDDIEDCINPFLNYLNGTQESVYFLQEVIFAQDRIDKYDLFWKIWDILYEPILKIANDAREHHTEELIYTYLFAWSYWNKGTTEWHSLKEREQQFYQKVVNDFGGSTAVLYSISKILNDVGSSFQNQGIKWLSDVIVKIGETNTIRLEQNTVYYLENLIRRYVYLNREKIKKDIRIKNQVLTILNFLILRTSVSAYLLREDIV